MDTTNFLYERPRFGTTTGSRSSPINSEFWNTGPGSYDIMSKSCTNKFGLTMSQRFGG